MKEQDLKQLWKNSSKTAEISFDTPQLINNFKIRMEDRELIVRRRDRREIIGAFIGIFGFGYSFYAYSNIISQIGSIIGLLSLFYIIYKLRSNRKSKFLRELFLPIHEQLVYQKQFMLNQFKLLDTVLYWVSMPIFIANTLLIWGVSKPEQSLTILEQLTTKWEAKLIITLIFAIIFGYIGWMNKKAAQINWEPLIKQIDTILENLKKGEK